MTTAADDQELAAQLERLRGLYAQTGEDEARSEQAISDMLEGQGALDRVRVTADAVARLWSIKE